MLPREADAAVELEAVADDEALAVAGRGLGHRRGHGAAVVVLGDRERGEVGERGGPLDGEVAVGQPVLERLERADRPAELLAVLGVLERGLEDGPARGHRGQRERGGGLLQRPLDDRGGARDRPAPRARGRRRPRRRRARTVATGSVGSITVAGVAGDRRRRGTTNTPRPSSPGGALEPGDHGELVGGGAVEHVGLRAVEHPAAAGAAGGGRGPPRAATRPSSATRACRCTCPPRRRRGGTTSPALLHAAAASCVSVARNGVGAATRPSSSTTMPTSRKPSPRPPCSSGMPRAGQSSPTSVCHRLAAPSPAPSNTARTRAGGQADGEDRPGAVAQLELVVGELEVHRRYVGEGQEAAADHRDHRLDGVGLVREAAA